VGSTYNVRRSRSTRPNPHIPDPHAPGALAVTDGTEFIGTVVKRDRSFFSFDHVGTLIGEWPSQTAAMRSIPKVQP